MNGVGTNNPTYLSPGYNGAGACLVLNKALSQSVTVLSPPILMMNYTSFTFEVWIYANSLCDGLSCSHNAIFGQLEQEATDQGLHLVIRNRHIYLGFYNDDISGNTVN